MSARGRRWWSRLGRKAADAAVGLIVVAVLGAVGTYLWRYVPGVGRYMDIQIGFTVPVWVLSAVAIILTGLVVATVFSRRAREKAEAEATTARERAASADQRADDTEARASAVDEEARKLREEIERHDRRAATFPWGGVEWPLTENFWGIVLRTSADDFAPGGRANPNLLSGAIGDPVCANPQCRRDVWRYAATNRCADCGTAFQLGLAGMEDVSDEVRLRLKGEVYREARAEHLRRQTS